MAECKVSQLSMPGLRQAVFYAATMNCYDAYMIFGNHLSKPVSEAIEHGEHSYSGSNRAGRVVTKRLILVRHFDGKFSVD